MSQLPPLSIEQLYKREAQQPNKVYLRQPINGQWQEYTWGQVGDQVRRIANALLSFKYSKGDKIAILSKNCMEWFVADLAIQMAGLISVPIYATANQDTIKYVLDHSEAKAIFIGKLDDATNQIAAIPSDIKKLGFGYEELPVDSDWKDLLKHNQPLQGSPVPRRDDVMTIIYTSGSTGNPKGVVLTFHAYAFASFNIVNMAELDRPGTMLSYLPLAHITERTYIEGSSLYGDITVSFVESLDTFAENLADVSPTLFISVPRLWTRFQMGVLHKIPQEKLDKLLKIPLFSSLIKYKIKKAIGLHKARLLGSGSAPISPSLLQWYRRLGINICEGWGMSESVGYGTTSFPYNPEKIGSIGRAGPGVDLQISPEGEILIKSDAMMTEYYKEPEKTREAIDENGYLHTGDRGTIDADGFVKITGRLKEIFKTEKGKYIAPVPIESLFGDNPRIEQICVMGSARKNPVAVVVLSEDAQKESKLEVEQSLIEIFQKVNSRLESHERLDGIYVTEQAWTIDNQMLTPTLKIKRHKIEEQFNFVNQIEFDSPVLWEGDSNKESFSQTA